MNFKDMTLEQKRSFNDRYMALYAESLDATDTDEYNRLKGEMIQMEIEVGLYGQI